MLRLKRQPSIQRNLINSVLLVFALFLFAVFISVDQGLDNWVEEQFDQSLMSQMNYLKEAVRYKDQAVHFDLEEPLLSQFSSHNHSNYYQLWQNGKTVGRSDSMQSYPALNLVLYNIPLGSTRIVTVTLPNGDSGRAALSYFVPNHPNDPKAHPKPVYLTVYQATISLDRLKIMVDILLVSSFILAIFLMRYIATRLIKYGLAPLARLNEEIKAIADSTDTAQLTQQLSEPKRKVAEVEPIRRELNIFIRNNQQFLENEKRITGDIAHELKTPIAELIALNEMALQYPDDQRISATYKQDMLAIATRMKSIVENLLLLQRTSSIAMVKQMETLSFSELSDAIITELTFKYPQIRQRLRLHIEPPDTFMADRFSLETLLTNLLDNALFYSPAETPIDLYWHQLGGQQQLQLSNRTLQPIPADKLEQLLKPLFQLDSSRANQTHHGLGLSIVDNICHQNGYIFDLHQSTEHHFIASIIFPRHPPK